MKKVIIAEKPSVAKNIADAYKIKTRRDGFYEGDDYLVTWAFGHLLQLYDAKDYDENMKGWRMDKFPFIPEGFKYKIKCDSSNREVVDKGAEKQINIIKGLIDRDDVDGVISATDFDREGQVISDELFIHYDIKKPIYRLLLNEWTEDEVKKGMANLKPNSEMKPLQDAGIGRQLADWTIGINLTSVATLRYGASEKKTINIGRVLLPTLKIIYDRDKEIENFKESSYYKLLINLKSKDNIEFESLYYENASEKFEKKEYLDNLSKLLKEKQAVVVDKEIEKKREYPQSLFNLSNLQGYITSKYKGWTSDKVLKVAQGLYEKKLITYPRTASSVLEESLVDKAKKVLETHKKGLPYEDQIKFVQSKRVFDNSKVESHSAITPTYVIPKGLTTDEQHVYNAIKNRFIMQFMPVAQFEETKITLKVNDEQLKGEFISKGKVEIVKGWRVVEKIESKDTILPLVEKGENLDIVDSKVNKVTKKPPKYHTEKTLLRVMETCGKSFKDDKDDSSDDESNSEEMMKAILSGFSIGTPATRAETIKKLKDIGYIKTKGKSLTTTELGRTIVEIFPAKELLDLEYTGRLEKTLSDIEKGKFKKEDFLNLIYDFTRSSVEKIKNDSSMLHKFKVEKPEGVEEIGKCPVCGNSIIEGEKGYGCVNWKNGCKYTIWKNDKFIESLGKKVTKEMVQLLLKNGKVGFRNLKSKKGTLFSAYLRYEKDEKTGYYNWKFEFIN
ncbi:MULTISPECIES: type IA DNA topoisomerase [Clostridium]|uniref:DNA topoisomerase n=3 Tax=Clostridium TaxID=1485 RepID=A0A174F1I4_9CLOT|nr:MULTISPECIES: type IA DNA topoisomerase [Clostridium]MBX9184437.1 type IA DNA topoisomerase [Clostridium sp. K04]MDU3522809.1 DNA topoisomerase [Clostridium saudiense]CUN64078.1 DNA topoisomerase [Clostridium disporicum]CUO42656.1 DNA topoisomerase [Clostridium disporicum]